MLLSRGAWRMIRLEQRKYLSGYLSPPLEIIVASQTMHNDKIYSFPQHILRTFSFLFPHKTAFLCSREKPSWLRILCSWTNDDMIRLDNEHPPFDGLHVHTFYIVRLCGGCKVKRLIAITRLNYCQANCCAREQAKTANKSYFSIHSDTALYTCM